MDRRLLTGFSLAGLLVVGLMAVVMMSQDTRELQLHATTHAVVLAADGPSTGAYQYRYSIADRVCRGQAKPEPPLPKPGMEIFVHYNPKDVCDSVTHDPVFGLIVDAIVLAFIGGGLAFIGWLSRLPEADFVSRSACK